MIYKFGEQIWSSNIEDYYVKRSELAYKKTNVKLIQVVQPGELCLPLC